MNARVFSGNIERLRSPERLAILEPERVVNSVLAGRVIQSVLDVGTGTGVFAERFAQHGLSVAAIDPNGEMLTAARGFVPEAKFQQAPAETLPFPDGAFDLVFLGHVLHEADDPVQALREARRVAHQRVAVLEWPYVQEEKGPPLTHRLSSQRVIELANQAGLGNIISMYLNHMVLYRMDLTRAVRR